MISSYFHLFKHKNRQKRSSANIIIAATVKPLFVRIWFVSIIEPIYSHNRALLETRSLTNIKREVLGIAKKKKQQTTQ